jgi:hypothetical protein
MLRLLLVLSSILTASSAVEGGRPPALVRIQELADRALASGETPIAVFDLDDTLVQTVMRSRRALEKALGATGHPELIAKLPKDPHDDSYLVRDTLDGVCQRTGACIKSQEEKDRIGQSWSAAFFSGDGVDLDAAVDGCAAKYVSALREAGVLVVYLTGRPAVEMRRATASQLNKLQFPTGAGTVLLMKPAGDQPDLAFKLEMATAIRKLGPVVASFENEPANVDALSAAFPGAASIFLETRHSPGAPEVWKTIERIDRFCDRRAR